MAPKTKISESLNGNPENGDNNKRPRLSTTTSMLQKSATLEIAAKAKRMNAQGLNVISFSAGERSEEHTSELQSQ